ncbi:MAG: hypothetical protein ABI665_01150 [Vicinamibacterales bacterium]
MKALALAMVLAASGALLAQDRAPLSGGQAALGAVLARTAAYVAEYQSKLAGIVAEEQYTQDVRSFSTPRPTFSTPPTPHRELRSDLLLVRPTGDGPWLQFRDVFEVDGKPLRDRDERLLKLFVDTKADPREQAESIATEGARYNIGPVTRTINMPVLALMFLTADHQPKSRFLRVSPGNLKRFAGVSVTGEIWAIEFNETATETLVRGGGSRDLPSRGRVWVEAATGRVLRTEHIAEDTLVKAVIEVAYGNQEGLSLLVPIEMRETYTFAMRPTRIFGQASYSRFRQFKVTTEEKTTKPPPGPLLPGR